MRGRVLIGLWVVVAAVTSLAPTAGAATARQAQADRVLEYLIQRLVASPGGPPGIAVVVDRGNGPVLHTAGVAEVGTARPLRLDDHMRIASVSKAFSGAAALSLVATGQLSLDTSIGEILPDLPRA